MSQPILSGWEWFFAAANVAFFLFCMMVEPWRDPGDSGSWMSKRAARKFRARVLKESGLGETLKK